MSDTPEKKAPAKKAAAPKAAAPKTAAPKKAAAAKPAAEAVSIKAASPKKPVAAKKEERTAGLKVTQIHSGAGRGDKQNATLKGLGLGKLHRSRILPDTPATRGMVKAVSHLVKMEKVG